MCSSTLSVNCEKAEKDTLREPDCRSYFSKRSPLSDLRQANKQGKGRSSKRKGNRRCPFLFAPRRAPQSPALRRAQLPAEVQRKNCRPLGANTLTQFAYPAQPVLKKLPPVRGEHANAVRVPRSAGAEKLPPVRGEPPAQFVSPGQPVLKKLPPVRGEHANAVRVPRSAGAEKTSAR